MVFKKMAGGVKEEIARPIGFAASAIYLASSLISLGNTLFSTWSYKATVQSSGISFPVLPVSGSFFRFVLFFILEACLATMFGWVMAWLFDKGRGLPAVLLILAGLTAAWTSLFNIQWLLLEGRPPGMPANLLVFLGAAIFVLVLDIYLTGVQWERLCNARIRSMSVRFPQAIQSRKRGLLLVRAFCFLVMCVAVLLVNVRIQQVAPPGLLPGKNAKPLIQTVGVSGLSFRF